MADTPTTFERSVVGTSFGSGVVVCGADVNGGAVVTGGAEVDGGGFAVVTGGAEVDGGGFAVVTGGAEVDGGGFAVTGDREIRPLIIPRITNIMLYLTPHTDGEPSLRGW